jgi:Predicted AAA-ATPase/PD-(D/E)XK nuclease superfamily
MSRRRIGIGVSDFKEFIEEGYLYVDKTLLIDELSSIKDKVVCFTRPRRFGKTLNLSMLHYYYENSEKSNGYLFEHTAIWKSERCRAFQGKYPVIFISLKSCKGRNWELVYSALIECIIDEFTRHFEVLSPHLSEHVLADYRSILTRTATTGLYEKSLQFLSRLLREFYQQRVIVLIDEYDSPIHSAYTYGYYDEMMDFMRALLTNVLKDNSSLERGILTGILRAAKEGIFSGLNNLSVFTLLDEAFCDKFGFTVPEVDVLLSETNLEQEVSSIKEWYNGYRCGNETIYNPWSLLKCVSNKGITDQYWANTSDNALIGKLIAQADISVKSDLELLLQGGTIEKVLDNGLIFPGMKNDHTALWSLLLYAGYLTFTQKNENRYVLTLPNREILVLYKDLIKSVFIESLGGASNVEALSYALSTANAKQFGELVQNFIKKSMSSYDLPDREPERSYHLFVLGLLLMVEERYLVKSNRESSYGRYDILVVPRDLQQCGIVIEFKKVSSGESMSKAADWALAQIKQKDYGAELIQYGVRKSFGFGVACLGKKILVKCSEL